MEAVNTFIEKIKDPDQKQTLAHIRSVIKKTCPEATECISYGMPAFKYKKKYLIGYCNFTHHMSVFPGAETLAALADDLVGFAASKGTVQFTREKPLPDTVLIAIIKQRMSEIDTGS